MSAKSLYKKSDVFVFQGSVLSCFFWGYTMTQFLGGYLADRIGGDLVLPVAACFWSIITFWTPAFAYLSTDKYLILHIIVISRVLLGVFQGKSFSFVFETKQIHWTILLVRFAADRLQKYVQ